MTTGYLLATGSRNAHNWLRATVRNKLNGIALSAFSGDSDLDRIEVIVGDAPGVDAEVMAWVRQQQDPRIVLHGGSPFVATWDADCDERCTDGHRKVRADGSTFCPAQGPYRNGRMVVIAKGYHDQGSWVRVAAFYGEPNSSGTKSCVEQAEAAGLIVGKFGDVTTKRQRR